MEKQPAYISITEASTLLGVHRNTVRNRIKQGRYKAHKVVTPQGETYAIEPESLGLPPHNTPHNGTNWDAQDMTSTVRDNSTYPPQPTALISQEQQAQADAIVQRLLAPFIAELSTVREELGRVKAERDAASAQLVAKDETISELRRRAEVAERALQLPETPAVETPRAHLGLWQRLRTTIGV